MTSELDNALALIDSKMVRTEHGSYVKVDDLKEAMKSQGEAKMLERATAPRPKTMAQAKRMARSDEELMKLFPDQTVPRPLGGSVPAMEPSAARA